MANPTTSQQWQQAAAGLEVQRAAKQDQVNQLIDEEARLARQATFVRQEVSRQGRTLTERENQALISIADRQQQIAAQQSDLNLQITGLDEEILAAEINAERSSQGPANTNTTPSPGSSDPNQPVSTPDPVPPPPVPLTRPADQAGEFEVQQPIQDRPRRAPDPVIQVDPETGLPVETLSSIEARQRFAAQDAGVSPYPYGEEDEPLEVPADTGTTVEDTEGYIVPDGTINVPPNGQLLREPTALGGDFTPQFDPETQTWGIYDNETGEFIQTGLTEEQARTDAAIYSVGDPGIYSNSQDAADPGLTPEQVQEQERRQRATEAQAAQAAMLAQLRQQATIQAQRNQANQGDWRVKLRLAEGADYLYLDPNIDQGSILWPLLITSGIIFPYTPAITTSYNANYNSYDLTHSNYRGYFYQNSYAGEVNLQATFTAQDTQEADYLLAVIHFFRSATKMFYGAQDPRRGSPPPLVFLQGLGQFQFNLHPCVIQTFTYSLPTDVDYIRARTVSNNGTNLQIRRQRDALPSGPFSASNARLSGAGLNPGAVIYSPGPPNLGQASPTYVPTKIDMTIVMLPIQSREQVSREFNMRDFANGSLIKRGFW